MSNNQPDTSLIGKAVHCLTVNHGVKHKKAHGFTTIATIPLVAWVMYSMLTLRNASYEEVMSWIVHPVNAVVVAFFVIVTFKHFAMELQVVFEDYVSDVPKRNAIIVIMKLMFFAVSVVTVLSVAKVALGIG